MQISWHINTDQNDPCHALTYFFHACILGLSQKHKKSSSFLFENVPTVTLCQCTICLFLICINSGVEPVFCHFYSLFVKCNRPTVL